MDYDLYLREEAFAFLQQRDSGGKNGILNFLAELKRDPFRKGDFSETDANGRDLEAIIRGKYAVLYWTDHATKEVKEVELRFADR
jgi:hypothetical protein